MKKEMMMMMMMNGWRGESVRASAYSEHKRRSLLMRQWAHVTVALGFDAHN